MILEYFVLISLAISQYIDIYYYLHFIDGQNSGLSRLLGAVYTPFTSALPSPREKARNSICKPAHNASVKVS